MPSNPMIFRLDPAACRKAADGMPEPMHNTLHEYTPFGVLDVVGTNAHYPIYRHNETGTMIARGSGCLLNPPFGYKRAIRKAEKEREKRTGVKTIFGRESQGRPKMLPECQRLTLDMPLEYLTRIERPYARFIREAVRLRLIELGRLQPKKREKPKIKSVEDLL